MEVRTNNMYVYVVYTYVLKFSYELKFQIPNSIKISFNGFNNNIFSFLVISQLDAQNLILL